MLMRSSLQVREGDDQVVVVMCMIQDSRLMTILYVNDDVRLLLQVEIFARLFWCNSLVVQLVLEIIAGLILRLIVSVLGVL